MSDYGRYGEGGIVLEGNLFSEEYVPDRITGRDRQLAQLRSCIASLNTRGRPIHAWLYGPTGSGKTVTARWVAREATASRSSLRAVHINCWERRSQYAVVNNIVEQLRLLNAELQDTNTKTNKIREMLRENGLAIILDEIDRPSPREREAIIYSLCDLPRTVLICVSEQKETFCSLGGRTRSRLNPVLVQFPSYTVREPERTLSERARLALCPDCGAARIAKQIAALATGDARVAIQGLWQTAMAADQASEDRLSLKHMPESMRKLGEQRREHRLSRLSDDQRLICELAAEHGPMVSKSLRKIYVTKCQERGISPVAQRTFSKYIKVLVLEQARKMAGWIKKHSKSLQISVLCFLKGIMEHLIRRSFE